MANNNDSLGKMSAGDRAGLVKEAFYTWGARAAMELAAQLRVPLDLKDDRPIDEWPVHELKEKGELIQECRDMFGKEATRELMVKLGFPIPPPELIEPLSGQDRRH